MTLKCGHTGHVMTDKELDALYSEAGDLYLSCWDSLGSNENGEVGRLLPSRLRKKGRLKRCLDVLGDIESLFCEIHRLKKKCGER